VGNLDGSFVGELKKLLREIDDWELDDGENDGGEWTKNDWYSNEKGSLIE
jgi:hypothetical protein